MYMTLEISTCHAAAGDLTCKHRFICHLHANDSLRHHFRPVSLCPNNDPSQSQISALAKLGHILSLHKTCEPLTPLPTASKLPVLTLLDLVRPPAPRYTSPWQSLVTSSLQKKQGNPLEEFFITTVQILHLFSFRSCYRGSWLSWSKTN